MPHEIIKETEGEASVNLNEGGSKNEAREKTAGIIDGLHTGVGNAWMRRPGSGNDSVGNDAGNGGVGDGSASRAAAGGPG